MVDRHNPNRYNVSEEKEVISHTLKDNQGRDLTATLEALLPKVTEEEKHKVAEGLLEKLKRLNPNPGQVWADLYLNEEEDELFEILTGLAWGLHKPKPSEGNG